MDNNDCLYKEILNHNRMYCILNWSTQTTGQNNGSLKVVKINTAIALVTADDSSPPTASCIYSTRRADLHGKHEVIIGAGGESKWHKWHAVEPNQYTVPSRNHRLTFPSSCGSWCDVWELSFSAECFCSSSTFNWFFFSTYKCGSFLSVRQTLWGFLILRSLHSSPSLWSLQLCGFCNG